MAVIDITHPKPIYPLELHPDIIEVLCVPTSPFGSTFLRNILFENFKTSYTGTGKKKGYQLNFFY